MKNLILLLFLSAFALGAKSQVLKNKEDLEFLYQAVQKLPSYKDQVKTNPKLKFDLDKDFTFSENEDLFEVFLKLYALIEPIRDNHLTFYSNPDSTFAKPNLFEINKSVIDSVLSAGKPTDSVCGTYYAGKYKFLIFKLNHEFISVSEFEGRYFTQFMLHEVTPNHFDQIGFVKQGGGYVLNRNIVYTNGRLVGTPYKKYLTNDFVSLPTAAPKYDFKEIGGNIAYLRLGSFSTNPEHIAESISFFNGIKIPNSTADLIVDLRNNGGGGYKTSKKFLDLIQDFRGKVHLLVNGYTVSNAEQFTIDLMNNPKVFIYGENTRGTICYGSNTDVVLKTPSKRFNFYITDMRARTQDLPYESIGIKPQINLDPFKKDWVEQVIDHIKQN